MVAMRKAQCQFCKRRIGVALIERHRLHCEKNPDRVPMMTRARVGVLDQLIRRGGAIDGADYPRGLIPRGELGVDASTLSAMKTNGLIVQKIRGKRLERVEVTPLGRSMHAEVVGDVPPPPVREPRGSKNGRNPTTRDAVVEFVRANGRVKAGQIADALGKPTSSISTSLSKAVELGDLAQPERGWYEAATNGTAPQNGTTRAKRQQRRGDTIVDAVNNGAETRAEIAAALNMPVTSIGGGTLARVVEMGRIRRADGRYFPVNPPARNSDRPQAEQPPRASKIKRVLDIDIRIAAAVDALGQEVKRDTLKYNRWYEQTKELFE